jgi:biopolymer transport protein ExbD
VKIGNDNSDKEVRVELIPLIDVIFCLLTFFLIAGLQFAARNNQQAIEIDIPKAQSGIPQARELLVVSLDDTGQTYIEQAPIAVQELPDAVKRFQEARPQANIVLYASKQVSYDRVIQILDLMRSVAGDRVALATVPLGSSSPTSSPTGSPTSSPANPVPVITPTDLLTPSVSPTPFPPLSPSPTSTFPSISPPPPRPF